MVNRFTVSLSSRTSPIVLVFSSGQWKANCMRHCDDLIQIENLDLCKHRELSQNPTPLTSVEPTIENIKPQSETSLSGTIVQQ